MDIAAHIFERLIFKAVETQTLEMHDAGENVKLVACVMGMKLRLATLSKKELGLGVLKSI